MLATSRYDTLSSRFAIRKARCVSNNSPLYLQFPKISILKDLIFIDLNRIEDRVALGVI